MQFNAADIQSRAQAIVGMVASGTDKDGSLEMSGLQE